MKKTLLVLLLFSSCARQPALLGPASVSPVVEQSASERANYEARGEQYMIASQGKEATRAAAQMFAQGGNIIDAAVAASFVISVERPQSTGLGGGGFFLFREAKTKKVYAIDFRERAPLAATRDMYLDAKGDVLARRSLDGISAVAVPGMVAGVLEIHKKFGVLSRAKVMAPAIKLAEEGLVVYPRLAEALQKRADILRSFPSSREIFIKPDGRPYGVGETIVQKDLGTSLRKIAKLGSRTFYKGAIARAILESSQSEGGNLSQRDLDHYRVKWRTPLQGSYNGYSLYSMPPPSSGGIHVLEILNILEHFPLSQEGAFSPLAIHQTASALQLAFADRAQYPGDPDFVKVPVKQLISKSYASAQAARIPAMHANSSQEVKPGVLPKDESLETTHFSILDNKGNMVASTQTINFLFGSGLVAKGTGILLNDEMDDFSIKPGVANVFGALGGDANAIAPGKTPLSSMSPTLVLRGDAPVMAVGAPGGTRIISCVVETILNRLTYGMPLYESVARPRFHHQWLPDRLDIDLPGPGPQVMQALSAMGYQTKLTDDAVSCRIEVVEKDGNFLHGVADPRDLGASQGI